MTFTEDKIMWTKEELAEAKKRVANQELKLEKAYELIKEAETKLGVEVDEVDEVDEVELSEEEEEALAQTLAEAKALAEAQELEAQALAQAQAEAQALAQAKLKACKTAGVSDSLTQIIVKSNLTLEASKTLLVNHTSNVSNMVSIDQDLTDDSMTDEELNALWDNAIKAKTKGGNVWSKLLK